MVWKNKTVCTQYTTPGGGAAIFLREGTEQKSYSACPFCAGMLYFSDKGQWAVRRFFRDKEKRLCESD